MKTKSDQSLSVSVGIDYLKTLVNLTLKAYDNRQHSTPFRVVRLSIALANRNTIIYVKLKTRFIMKKETKRIFVMTSNGSLVEISEYRKMMQEKRA